MDYIKIYADFLKNFLKPQHKLRVIFDCSNGTAGIILKNLKTEKLKAILINQRPDGNFPAHGPNPLMPDALKQIQKAVIKHKADFGIIFDADGDRAFFIDDKGRLADPDAVANLLIWHLKLKRVVVNETTSSLIRTDKNYKTIKSQNGGYFMKKTIKRNGADFGCERSGHYYFREFFGLDSGILSAIEVINAVSKLPYKFSVYLDLLPKYYHSGDINIKYQASNISYQNLLKQTSKVYKKQVKSVSYIDGLRMNFDNWWFNLQPSNTEPLIRLNIEANSKNLLNRKIKELKKLIK